jgi:O-antigen/teichoic acid export membrane protein
MIFPWILSTVMLSLLSHHLAGDRRAQFDRLLLVGLAASLGAVVIGQIFILIAGRPMLQLYGEPFLAGLPVLHVLMISFAAEALALPLYQVLTSRGRMWRFLAVALLPRDFLVAGLALMWLEKNGGIGLAWAHSVAYAFSLLASAGLVWLARQNITAQSKS